LSQDSWRRCVNFGDARPRARRSKVEAKFGVILPELWLRIPGSQAVAEPPDKVLPEHASEAKPR